MTVVAGHVDFVDSGRGVHKTLQHVKATEVNSNATRTCDAFALAFLAHNMLRPEALMTLFAKG